MINFWEGQAKKYGFDLKAVNFDPLEDELEFDILGGMFKKHERVCDLGCGNGRTTLGLAKRNKDSEFVGVDFIPGFIGTANKQKEAMKIANASFLVGNAGSKTLKTMFSQKFDKVITKRLLINLKGRQRSIALENIHSILKPGGLYIMVECFCKPLSRINLIRKDLGLAQIKVKEFNHYLPVDFLKDIAKRFKLEKEIDFESLYYFISRVFNAYLAKGKPDYNADINKLAVTLSKNGFGKMIQGYSPQIMYILRNNK